MQDSLIELWQTQGVQTVVARSVRALVIVVAALIASRFVRRVIERMARRMSEASARDDRDPTGAERGKRISTLAGLVGKTAAVLVWGLAVVMALREAGFDIVPLLAGAGVAGLAIGFGAQNLVRDAMTGAFMLLENQIRVGDVVTINGTGGAVQEVNLRTTVLRDLEGVVHVFPNGEITMLSNKTQQFSHYVFEVGVAYKENTDEVVAILKTLGAEFIEDPDWKADVLDPLEILGVDRFDDSAVIIKMRIKTKPGRQWAVGREMNRRIKLRFDEAGVEIPFPHQTLYFGEVSPPIQLKIDGPGKDVIRGIVREELTRQGQDGGDSQQATESTSAS